MVTTINTKDRGKVFNAQRVVLAQSGGPFNRFFIMRPDLQTHINLDGGADTVQVEVTTSVFKKSGAILTDLEDADVIWQEKHNTTGLYNEGGSYGITGVQITTTPTNNDVDISLSQTEGR